MGCADKLPPLPGNRESPRLARVFSFVDDFHATMAFGQHSRPLPGMHDMHHHLDICSRPAHARHYWSLLRR